MPKKKLPVTFDAWLGKIVDDETQTYGGRLAVATWLGVSMQTMNRRARGEAPYLAREIAIISEHIDIPVAEIVTRALRGYGGIEKLLAEHAAVSEAAPTVDPADNVTYIGRQHEIPEHVAADTKPRRGPKD